MGLETRALGCRHALTDVGQVLAGRVLDFQGRTHGRERELESQQRLNRHVAQLIHCMRKKCFPEGDTAEAIACTDTHITNNPGGESDFLYILPEQTSPEFFCSI